MPALENSLWNLLSQLRSCHFVDLTHGFEPGIPHASDMPNEERSTLYDFEADGFQAHRYTIAGQWGTHVDAPIHFAKGGRTLDEIRPEEMILPLVVINVEASADVNPDYAVTMLDITNWQTHYGPIPPGAFVALRTGWSTRWPDAARMRNLDEDGVAHSPGWSIDVLRFLCEERGIAACGHETADTDPGLMISRDQFPAETYVLSQDKYQIELLTNLNQVPEAGAIVVATFPKPIKGSGFPARVFAICP
jgi:kynurenine formamidase